MKNWIAGLPALSFVLSILILSPSAFAGMDCNATLTYGNAEYVSLGIGSPGSPGYVCKYKFSKLNGPASSDQDDTGEKYFTVIKCQNKSNKCTKDSSAFYVGCSSKVRIGSANYNYVSNSLPSGSGKIKCTYKYQGKVPGVVVSNEELHEERRVCTFDPMSCDKAPGSKGIKLAADPGAKLKLGPEKKGCPTRPHQDISHNGKTIKLEEVFFDAPDVDDPAKSKPVLKGCLYHHDSTTEHILIRCEPGGLGCKVTKATSLAKGGGSKKNKPDKSCTAPKVLSKDGKGCEDPKSDTKPPATPSVACTPPQVLSADSKTCVDQKSNTPPTLTCAAPKVPSKDGKTCEDPKIEAKPPATPPIACSSPQVPSQDGKTCVDPKSVDQSTMTCTAPKILSKDGKTCEDPKPSAPPPVACTTPKVLSADGKSCIDPKPGNGGLGVTASGGGSGGGCSQQQIAEGFFRCPDGSCVPFRDQCETGDRGSGSYAANPAPSGAGTPADTGGDAAAAPPKPDKPPGNSDVAAATVPPPKKEPSAGDSTCKKKNDKGVCTECASGFQISDLKGNDGNHYCEQSSECPFPDLMERGASGVCACKFGSVNDKCNIQCSQEYEHAGSKVNAIEACGKKTADKTNGGGDKTTKDKSAGAGGSTIDQGSIIGFEDDCKTAIINAVIRDRKDGYQTLSQDHIISDINAMPDEEKQSYVERYGCDKSRKELKSIDSYSKIIDTANSAGAQQAAAGAVGLVSAASGDDKENVHTKSLRAMKTATYTVGTQQTLAGAAQLVLAYQADTIEDNQRAATENDSQDPEIKSLKNLTKAKDKIIVSDYSQATMIIPNHYVGVTEKEKTLTSLAHSLINGETGMPEKASTNSGNIALSEDLKQKEDLADAAKTIQNELMLKAAMNIKDGALKIAEANMMEEQAQDLGTGGGSSTVPLVAGAPDSKVGDGQSAPSVTPGATGMDSSNAFTAEDAKKDDGGADGSFYAPPPLAGGGGGAGGLKDAPLAPNGGLVGATGGGGSGGGAAGGGGSGAGGGGGAGGGEDEGEGDIMAGDKTRFEGTGGGGMGYAAVGGGGGARHKDTGVDMNAMLAGLIGKKDDEKGRTPSSILEFNGKNGPNQGSGSEVDDGSVLGKGADTFKRASKVFMKKYQTKDIGA